VSAAAGAGGEEAPLWSILPVSAAAAVRMASGTVRTAAVAVGPCSVATPAGAKEKGTAAASQNPPSPAIIRVLFDPCFPMGRDSGFVNCGLAAWHQHRAQWCSRPPGYAHSPYPPELDDELDDLLDELIDTNVRELELPGPVRLPDMVDLLLEVWSPVDDDSDSDENW